MTRMPKGLVAVLIVATALATAGGPAQAAKVKKNSVTTKSIRDGAVTTADVADGTIAAIDVLDGSLTGADVQDNSLTGADIDESSLSLPAVPPFSLPFAGSGNDSGTLFRVTQNGNGRALEGVTTSSSPVSIGVLGTGASGIGVGATSDSGVPLAAGIINPANNSQVASFSTAGGGDVLRLNSNGTGDGDGLVSTTGDGDAVRATAFGGGASVLANRETAGTALEVRGGIRLATDGEGGTPSFRHTVDTGAGGNVCGASGQFSVLSSPYANGDLFAMIQITVNGTTGVPFNRVLEVRYEPGGGGCPAERWVVAAADGNALPNGLQVNVLIIN